MNKEEISRNKELISCLSFRRDFGAKTPVYFAETGDGKAFVHEFGNEEIDRMIADKQKRIGAVGGD